MSRSRSKLAASHQRSWLWGRHVVQETLSAARWPILELLLAEEADGCLKQAMLSEADDRGIRIKIESSARIHQLTGAADHQGLAARMAEYQCGDTKELAQFVNTRMSSLQLSERPPLIVVCDRLQDSHNFGAILRCCDGVAADAVVIGQSEQASVTPHVARSSMGAVNNVNLFRIPDLISGVQMLKTAGVSVAAASEKSSTDFWSFDLKRPIALIIGSEAFGISDQLLDECDMKLRIPMFGRIESLNAAVAAGILLYEIRRQLV